MVGDILTMMRIKKDYSEFIETCRELLNQKVSVLSNPKLKSKLEQLKKNPLLALTLEKQIYSGTVIKNIIDYKIAHHDRVEYRLYTNKCTHLTLFTGLSKANY